MSDLMAADAARESTLRHEISAVDKAIFRAVEGGEWRIIRTSIHDETAKKLKAQGYHVKQWFQKGTGESGVTISWY